VRVAELVHFKTVMLLLHQQRGAEALAQLREHLGMWGQVPGEGPREAGRITSRQLSSFIARLLIPCMCVGYI
jgi:hypothetical protein